MKGAYLDAQIEFKGEGGGRILLSIIDYERPAAADPDDANWLSCQAEVAAGPFRGSTEIALRTFDLISFDRELVRLLSEFQGDASFATDEGMLEFAVVLKKTGQGRVSGRLRYIGNARATLEVTFATDQTYLRMAEASLRDAIASFPKR